MGQKKDVNGRKILCLDFVRKGSSRDCDARNIAFRGHLLVKTVSRVIATWDGSEEKIGLWCPKEDLAKNG